MQQATPITPKVMMLVSFDAYMSPAAMPETIAHNAVRLDEVPVHPDNKAKREEDEKDLLNVVPAVEYHGGRDGNEDRGPDECVRSMGIQRQEECNQKDAADGGDDPEVLLLQVGKTMLAIEPCREEREIVERRTVILVAVVPVVAGLEQGTELHGMDGLVRVHRPDSQVWQAQERACQHRGQDHEYGTVHLTGLPYTSTSI